MRHVLLLTASLLALGACQKKSETAAQTGEAAPAASAAPAAASSASAPLAAPRRKAGLWKQTVSSEGSTQTMTLCLDDATEAKMTVWGGQITRNACPKNDIRPTAGGWSFESECDMGGGGKVATKGTATGDFASSYVVKATSVTTGSSIPSANGTADMEMTGTWAGACPAGMKPGDMTLPGGMKMNLNTIAAMKK